MRKKANEKKKGCNILFDDTGRTGSVLFKRSKRKPKNSKCVQMKPLQKEAPSLPTCLGRLGVFVDSIVGRGYSLGSQSMPESSFIKRSRYFCTDFSGVVLANADSFSLPSGDIQTLTRALAAWNLATALRWDSLDTIITSFALYSICKNQSTYI